MQPTNNNNQILQQNVNTAAEKAPVGIPFPVELAGIIPEGVWQTLAPIQQHEILRQHGLTHYIPEQAPNAENPISIGKIEQIPPQAGQEAPRIIDNQGLDHEKAQLKQQFESAVASAKQLESEHQLSVEKEQKASPEVRLTEDEKKRVAQEQGKNLATGNQPPKLFGYAPSQSLVTNATTVADDGNVSDASTWTATILKKLWAMLGF
ncbi:MAG: hypothetical protein Fur003_4270 [Candidatus Dojkabacteria bacterium]